MPLAEHICKCGREIPRRLNSTIQAKECPHCTYEKAVMKSPKGPGSTFKTKTRKSSGVKKKPVKRLKDSSYYMREADKWFSRLVRLQNSVIVDGEVYCKDIITGKIYAARNIDCGHLRSRANMSTRYSEDNCRPQNRSSNRFRGEADKEIFQTNLEKEIGSERVKSLFEFNRTDWKFGMTELWIIAEECRYKVNQLLEEKQAKKWW